MRRDWVDDAAAAADAAAATVLDAGQAVGLTVAVARDGRVAFARGYGQADRASGRTAAPDTVYRLGSLTKQFTAAAVLRTHAGGCLSLRDSVSRWSPAAAAAGHAARLEDLVVHTGGVAGTTPALAALAAAPCRPDDEGRAADAVASAPAEFAPGTAWRYSNGGYLLLGQAVACAAGRPFADHVRHGLLIPLGFEATDEADALPAGAAAVGYELLADPATGVGRVVAAEYVNMAAVGASGAWCGTAVDLARWDVVWRAEAARRGVPNVAATFRDGTPVGYGAGVFEGAVGGVREHAHRGDIPGGSAFKAWYPDAGVTIVVLTNTLGAPASRVGRRVARAALGLAVPDRWGWREVRGADAAGALGTYRDGRAAVTLALIDERVVAWTPDGATPLLVAPGAGAGGRAASCAAACDPDVLFHLGAAPAGGRLVVTGPGLRFDGRRVIA